MSHIYLELYQVFMSYIVFKYFLIYILGQTVHKIQTRKLYQVITYSIPCQNDKMLTNNFYV